MCRYIETYYFRYVSVLMGQERVIYSMEANMMLISILPLFIYHVFWSLGEERSSENIFQSLQKTQHTIPLVIYLRKNTTKCLCSVLLVAWLKQSSVASSV